jgi:biotin carboxylase
MGLETHVFDIDKDAIGKNYAHKFYPISIFDKEAILNIAKKEIPVGIHAVATEQGNITSCFVAEKLGLISNSYETALNTTDKLRMKLICKNNNILSPKYTEYINLSDIELDDVKIPSIIKPSDRSAGRGVKLINSKNEILESARDALSLSFNNSFLIEEYIDADQYSLETITHNGVHELVAITKMGFNGPPDFVENFHYMPPVIEETLLSQLHIYSNKVLNAFDIKCGACHVEVRIDGKHNIYLIEIASRLGGYRDWMIEAAFGYNFCQSIINTSLGLDYIDLKFKKKGKMSASRNLLYKNDYQKYFNIKKNASKLIYISLVKENKLIDTGAKNLIETDGPYILSIDESDRHKYLDYLS